MHYVWGSLRNMHLNTYPRWFFYSLMLESQHLRLLASSCSTISSDGELQWEAPKLMQTSSTIPHSTHTTPICLAFCSLQATLLQSPYCKFLPNPTQIPCLTCISRPILRPALFPWVPIDVLGFEAQTASQTSALIFTSQTEKRLLKKGSRRTPMCTQFWAEDLLLIPSTSAGYK